MNDAKRTVSNNLTIPSNLRTIHYNVDFPYPRHPQKLAMATLYQPTLRRMQSRVNCLVRILRRV